MDAIELCYLRARELGAAIRTKQVSPVEVVDAVLARIEHLNPRLNAYGTVTAAATHAAAPEAEAAVMRGDSLEMRHGIPRVDQESDGHAGNVRELRNVVEGLVLMTAGETVTVADLPSEFAASIVVGTPTHGTPGPIAVTGLDAVERDAIRAAILTYHGNLT
jgi:hypothetical protein